MPPLPQSQQWPADRAILLVHGVGNASPGDYDPLVGQLQAALGAAAGDFAVYFQYYDQVNDWFADKLRAGDLFARLVRFIRRKAAEKTDDRELGDSIAEFAGDVVWPVLLADARHAVRAALLAQMQRMVLDGEEAGFAPREQHLSIICHSMGCFHTYEALHAAAADPAQRLAPATWGVRFDNVIFMASPVQMIRSVAGEIGAAVPQHESLHCLAPAGLSIPSEPNASGRRIRSARRTVSITGDLDPVGGHFLRSRADWAYMRLEGQEAFVDAQPLVDDGSGEARSLSEILRRALRERAAPAITAGNPHDWGGYVARHEGQLRDWLVA